MTSTNSKQKSILLFNENEPSNKENFPGNPNLLAFGAVGARRGSDG